LARKNELKFFLNSEESLKFFRKKPRKSQNFLKKPGEGVEFFCFRFILIKNEDIFKYLKSGVPQNGIHA